MCDLAGILASLQFSVYECHRIELGFAWVRRDAWLGVLYVLRYTRNVFGRGADAQGEAQTGVPVTQVVLCPPWTLE